MKQDIIYFKEENFNSDEDLKFPIFASFCTSAVKEGKNFESKYILATMMYLLGEGETNDGYKKILKKDIEYSVRVALNVAEEFSEMGEFDTALSICHGGLLISDSDFRILFLIALIFEKKYIVLENKDKKLIEEIERILHLVLDKSPDFSPALYKLGFYSKHNGKFLEAKLYFERFIKYSDDEILKSEVREELEIIIDDAYFEEAILHFEIGKYDEAIEDLLKIKKRSSNVDYYLSISYLRLGDLNMAFRYLNNAIETDPSNWFFYNELGNLYYENNLFSEALETYTNGIENAESNYVIYANRSLLYTRLGQYEKALIDIEIAYELNQDEEIKARYDELRKLME